MEKGGTLLRGVSTKIRGIGSYLLSSLALAGTLAYSSPTFAQEQPAEAKKEEKKEQPAPKPEKIKFLKEPESFLSWHVKGEASPNGDSQGSLGLSDIIFSLKDTFKAEVFAASGSSSYLDQNGIRTLVNNPYSTKVDLEFNHNDLSAVLGFRGSLEETIRRNSTFSSTSIGTSTVEVSTRNKTVDTLEHYGALAEINWGSLVVSVSPYESLFPTVNEHEITQKVIDPNPAASYESNFSFRDPTARNKKVGALLRAGYTKELKEDFYLSTDLVGILEQETLEFLGAEKREIQKTHIGLDAFLDMPLVAPRFAIFRGFLDDRINNDRHADSPNATKFLGSVYFDAKVIKETDDPTKEVIQKIGFPLLAGGTFIYDQENGEGDRYFRKSGSAVLGFGNASGREALSALAKIEEDLALKSLGLRPEDGSVLSRAHSLWEAYERPFRIVKKDTFGLLLTGRYTSDRINGNNNIFYEGQAYGIFDSVLLNVGITRNKDAGERSWNIGGGYFIREGVFLGVDYTESKRNNKIIGTYSAGAKVFLK